MHRKISAVVALLHIADTSRLMTLMKADSRAIFTAAAAASKAADYLLGFLQAPPWEELASPADATADFHPAA
jgi:antirestriction protein ArdC